MLATENNLTLQTRPASEGCLHELDGELRVSDAGAGQTAGKAGGRAVVGVRVHFEDIRFERGAVAEVHAGIVAAAKQMESPLCQFSQPGGQAGANVGRITRR